MGKTPNEPEPKPIPNQLPPVWALVIQDMVERDVLGREKYGTPLQPLNGREAIKDLYQEILDAAVYLRQEIWEREKSQSTSKQVMAAALADHLWNRADRWIEKARIEGTRRGEIEKISTLAVEFIYTHLK